LGEGERAEHLGTIVFAMYVGAQQTLPPIDGASLRRLYGTLTDAFALFEEK
jgi:hypothetical protein